MNSIVTLISKIFVFLYLVSALPAHGNENVFIVADDQDATPYIFANCQRKPEGIFYDIIDKSFRRIKVPLQYDVYPWKRAQLQVQTRKADALITIPTPERLKYLVPSHEPVFVMRYKIFTQSDNPNIAKIRAIRTLAELKDLKIIDYIGDGWAEKNLAQYGVEWSPNLSSVCKMLAAHRGDVFLQDEAMVRYAINNIKKNEGRTSQNYDRIIAIDAPVPAIKFHLMVRKDSPYLYLLPQFDAALRAMHKDGDFDKITHKWLQ
ncbi:amino acid ABC transporter substrate-binding protein [Desulfopila sp. IMCC35006]|uniref:substrate-binding periplasmic protein n=1 Tax=Desulfopila sp. IMCC35006 TaxID=2569542 RepID=UPI0010ACFEA3|nr:transporter substrate-binding domain-containing protein [Desulfopila sp. IMCC35006]TKB23796.1 amino acid ABC transporter substrate-binding protein [Desulfopila sp. IMCC35006]